MSHSAEQDATLSTQKGASGSAENDAPVCRVCHIKSLSKYERTRAWDEPVTGCIYLCPEHQAAEDAMLAAMREAEYIKARRPEQPYVFPPAKGGPRANA